MSDPVTIEDIYQLFRTSQAEFDRRIAESERLAEQRAAEAARSLEELKRNIANTTCSVDALTTPWERFVEQLVEPAVFRLFEERGIYLTQLASKVRTHKQGLAMEIDILAINDNDVVAVECKSRLSYDDVNDFIGKLQRFKLAFPQYTNLNVFGAVAGIEINDGIDVYAEKRGLYVIKPSGDTVEIINSTTFQAIAW